jgi:hypothetical protein
MAVTMHVVMIAQAGVRMVMLCGQLLCRRWSRHAEDGSNKLLHVWSKGT